jgi:hypothetical protein
VSGVEIVALTKLATSPEVEAPLLAQDLGITAYEARQKLAVGMPCVLLVTPDRARALSLLGALRGRAHGAVACEGRDVVPSGAMVHVRRFHLDAGALVLDPSQEGQAATAPERVPYAEMLALVRATHRRSFETHEETKEKKFRPAAALMSGGVILTKTVKRDVVRTAEEKEQVLYIVRKGRVPCLLCEGSAHYAGLGDAVRATRMENFTTTVRLLRERAPAAAYDERLVSLKKAPEPPNDPGAPRAFDRETGGIDLLVHLLALSLETGAPPAYR